MALGEINSLTPNFYNFTLKLIVPPGKEVYIEPNDTDISNSTDNETLTNSTTSSIEMT